MSFPFSDLSKMDLDSGENFDDIISNYDLMSPIGEIDTQPRKRGRKVPKLGVGGFIVRPVRQRSTTVESKLQISIV